ncbi:MAG TPA: DUF502 domain-containing protein [Leucothrix mucor]|nr:DUF502 domain-containing protein [Leucothrix mucor]
MLARLRKYLITGLLVWVPLGVTILVIKLLVEMLDKTLLLLPHAWQPANLFGFDIPGLGIVLSTLFIFITGFLITNIAGRKLVSWGERLLDRIPLVRSIYSALKQVTETVLSPDKNSFRQVVLIEYPRRGIWIIGFQTSDSPKELNQLTEEKLLTIFIPTTPNPTSGFIIMVPAKDTKMLDMDVEDALKMVISLGVVTPKHIKQPKDST